MMATFIIDEVLRSDHGLTRTRTTRGYGADDDDDVRCPDSMLKPRCTLASDNDATYYTATPDMDR